MTKGILTLYVDNELKELAKSKGINLSSFFNEVLGIEIEYRELKKNLTQEQEIGLLKNKVALLSGELKDKNKEIESLKKKEPVKEKSKVTIIGGL